MRWFLMIAMASLGSFPAFAGYKNVQVYGFAEDRTLVCRDSSILRELKRPDALERHGQMNFQRLAERGDCIEARAGHEVVVCFSFGDVQMIAPSRDGYMLSSICAYVMAADLVPLRRIRIWVPGP